MKFKVFFYLMAGSSLALSSTIAVNNGSFESPVMGNGSYSYYSGSPDGTWSYNGPAGIASENSPWFIGTPPDGAQAAFCQGNLCEISQTVTGFTVGETYTVSFYAAQRSETLGLLAFDVKLGGVDLGTYGPPNTGFTQFTTSAMTAASDSLVLEFIGQSDIGDHDGALDLVTITSTERNLASTPEPNFMVLLGAAIAFLAVRRRSRP